MNILGTGSAQPKKTITNDDLSQFLDTSDEWISTRTGIHTRQVISDETLDELAILASKNALKNADICAEQLGMIICSTVGGDHITPATACIVQGGVGADCPAFDINAACAGFVYAMDVAEMYLKAGCAKYILVVCAEAVTRIADWSDRSSCVLFGDGAGAVVVGQGKGYLSSRLTTKSNTAVLSAPAFGGNCPYTENKATSPYLHMAGQEVYRFAVSHSTEDIRQAVAAAGVSLSDIRYFILHQANMRILKAVRSRLGEGEEKFPSNIAKCGNTSSASIPLLLDELNRSGRLAEGDLLAFSAFGAGLTTGACVLRWGKNQ